MRRCGSISSAGGKTGSTSTGTDSSKRQSISNERATEITTSLNLPSKGFISCLRAAPDPFPSESSGARSNCLHCWLTCDFSARRELLLWPRSIGSANISASCRMVPPASASTFRSALSSSRRLCNKAVSPASSHGLLRQSRYRSGRCCAYGKNEDVLSWRLR